MKRFAIFLLAFVVVAAIFTGCKDNSKIDGEQPGNDDYIIDNTIDNNNINKNNEENQKNYKEVYLEIAEQLCNRYEGVQWTFGLEYIDGDDLPELVACYPATVSVYTCSDGKLYTVMEEFNYGFAGNNGYYFKPKENVIYNTNYEMAGIVVYETYCKINENKQLENYHDRPLYTSMWKDTNGDGNPDDYEIGDTVYYFYGNNEISKDEYEAYRFGEDYEVLYGEMTFDELKAFLEK